MKKFIKYSLIITGWIILGVIVLLLIASLLIQTRPVKNKLITIAENQAGKLINAELSIGKLDGNFFTGIVLNDVLLAKKQDTIAYIAEINASYNLLPLLRNTIEIKSAEIKKPYFNLKQDNDSTWNFQNMIKQSGQKKDTTKSGGMNFILSDLTISEGNIDIEAIDSIIPKKINDWTTNLAFQLTDNEMKVDINRFKLSTVHPDFVLNRLKLKFEKKSDYFKLSDFYIKTAKNSVDGKAVLDTSKPVEGSADLKTTNIQLNEFEYFIPTLKIPAKPVANIQASINSDSMHVTVSLKENDQSIKLNLKSSNLADYLFNKSNEPLNYELKGDFKNVELGHWIGNPNFDYFINGDLTANGNGIKPAEASVKVKANLNKSIVEEKQFKELLVDLELDRGNLHGTVNGDGEFGWFRIDPKIKDIFDNPQYTVNLETRNLNLANILGNDSLSSNLNITAAISGQSFDPKKLSANARILMSESKFRDLKLDTLVAEANYKNSNIQVDSLWLSTQSTKIIAGGNYHLKGNSDIHVNAEFDATNDIQLFLPLQGLKSNGELKAQLTGRPDSLTMHATLNLDETRYQNTVLQGLQLDADGHIAGADTTFDAQLKVHDFVTGKLAFDSITAQVNGSPDSLFAIAGVSNKDLNTSIQTGFVPGDMLKFTINDWQISYKNQQWALQQPPAVFEMDSANYTVHNFRLASLNKDSIQTIHAEGKISRNGKENFKLTVSDIKLKELFKTLEKEADATGTLKINLDINGTAIDPMVNGNFKLKNAAFNKYNFTNFNGNIHYSENKFGLQTKIVSEDSGKVDINAELPLQLNLDTMGYSFNPDDSIAGKVVIDSFSLGILQVLNIAGDISGYLEGKVDLGGTFSKPDPKGNIRLVNAGITDKEYGIDYNKIKLNINFLKNSVVLDTLFVAGTKGNLTGGGKVNFSSGFYKGDVSRSEIQLNFNDFRILDHNQFNMEVSGNASIGGKKGNVVFDGNLKIPQAEIYLPAVMSMLGRINTPEMPKPILVKRAESMNVSLDSLGIQTFEPAKPDSVQFTYLNQLEGQLKINIPKNTWIKNDNMRVEISGNIELIKNKNYFELFGSVETVRGQYDLLGRTFVIKNGSISFQGGEEINPHLNIDASYSFRNQGSASQELTVQITGTLNSPDINFMLNGSSVNEGDALSYILFGKAMNELTMNEQQNVQGAGAEKVAEKAAASVVSSQLSSFLGDKLNLDYLEVKSENGFDNASVVVGQYITKDLFVSYEQRFGQTDEKDVAKYEVKLEYELFKFLFFKLNNSSTHSGFDVVVKLDAE